MPRPAQLVATLAACALALTACAGSGDQSATAPGESTAATGATASSSADGQAPVTEGVAQVGVRLVGDDGGRCVLDYASAPAGPITFTVTNESATSIIEVEVISESRILGEKENLAPGLPPVAFTVTLGGGAYQVFCPGAAEELVPFTVTGAPAPVPTGGVAAILAEGTAGYGEYVVGVVEGMVTAVAALRAAVDSGDVDAAQTAYAAARPYYERIESDIEGFVLPGFEPTDPAGSLDYLIDMRASSLDDELGWHGFHAIERDLFERGAITDETKALAAELVGSVDTLAGVVAGLQFRPEDLANGAAVLLEEVQSGKITGEEELYSHLDLVDFAGNIEGAQQAFAFLAPGMREIDPELTERIEAEFAKVNALLDAFRDPAELGGFKRYTDELRAQSAPAFAKAVQALQEPLSRIAEKVATAR